MSSPRFSIAAACALFLCIPAIAVAQVPGEKPKTDGQTMGDAITQPLADTGLKKKEIPPELIAIRDNPYSLEGLRNCRAIAAEVTKLNEVLGADFDEIEVDAKSRKRRESIGRAAGGLVSSLIPFRFLIREISGASQADRDYRATIFAGVVRRGFLKGLGQQRKCRPPARPLRSIESAQAAAKQVLEDAADDE